MFESTLWRISLVSSHRSHCPSRISKPRRPPPPHLTIGLETFYHHLPLRLVLPEVLEDLVLIWVVRTNLF
jgi:hypothetical protein